MDIAPINYRLLYPGNPWAPLPADYGDLTKDGQKQARLATICKQDTPMDLVAAWDLFRRLYLLPTDPGFFYHSFVESPAFHYQAVYDLGDWARNILVAPRGFSKSTVIGTEVPLFFLLTRKYMRIALALATDRMIEGRFDTIIKQLVENPYILEDFGEQKPKRGQAIWNRHHINLKERGSKLEGFSVTGRKRGARPDFIILDDPEYDPESDTATAALVLKEKFETLLFRQIIPMLEKGSAIFWVGTMINRRSFLYHACYGKDSRFQYWNRRILKARAEDTEGVTQVLWDQKYDEDFLKAKEGEIGSSAFMAEYQNDPVSEQERVLRVDPHLNEYSIEEYTSSDPFQCTSDVSFYRWSRTEKKLEPVKEPFNKLIGNMFRVILYDPAEGLSQHHDYSCIAIVGIDTDNCLWVLDMWMGRAKEIVLQNKFYAMGLKWQPRVAGIEAVSDQIAIVDSMSTFLEGRREGGWFPRIVPVNYSQVKGDKSKPSRIATLEWRFQTGKIKYPEHLKDRWPISQLYAQTRDFTYDLALLPHDDAIDTVAMSSFVVHGRGVKGPNPVKEPTLLEQIKAGQLRIANVPILSGMNASDLDNETLNALINRTRGIDISGQSRYNNPVSPEDEPIIRKYRTRHFKIKRPKTRGAIVR
jgi:hypothetical protein